MHLAVGDVGRLIPLQLEFVHYSLPVDARRVPEEGVRVELMSHVAPGTLAEGVPVIPPCSVGDTREHMPAGG